jgi:hypothetical protein
VELIHPPWSVPLPRQGSEPGFLLPFDSKAVKEFVKKRGFGPELATVPSLVGGPVRGLFLPMKFSACFIEELSLLFGAYSHMPTAWVFTMSRCQVRCEYLARNIAYLECDTKSTRLTVVERSAGSLYSVQYRDLGERLQYCNFFDLFLASRLSLTVALFLSRWQATSVLALEDDFVFSHRGFIGGKASVETHGEQMRNGGLASVETHGEQMRNGGFIGGRASVALHGAPQKKQTDAIEYWAPSSGPWAGLEELPLEVDARLKSGYRHVSDKGEGHPYRRYQSTGKVPH